MKMGLSRHATTSPEGCSAVVRLLAVYLVVSSLLVAMASAQTFYEEKKNDPNSRPFYMGSRYGRSGPQQKVLVAPRTDRFFMGSRYGKRGGLAAAADGAEESSPELVDQRLEGLLGAPEAPEPGALRCAYLGVGNLYRCFHRESNPTPAR